MTDMVAWIDRILEGPENPQWYGSERIAAVMGTLRQLADPLCEGSEEVLNAIRAERRRRLIERRHLEVKALFRTVDNQAKEEITYL